MEVINHPKEKRMFPKGMCRLSEKYKFISESEVKVAMLTNHKLKDYYLPYLVNGEFAGIFKGKQRVYGYNTPEAAFTYGKELIEKFKKRHLELIAYKRNFLS